MDFRGNIFFKLVIFIPRRENTCFGVFSDLHD